MPLDPCSIGFSLKKWVLDSIVSPGFDFCALTQSDRGTVHFPSDHDPFGVRTLAFCLTSVSVFIRVIYRGRTLTSADPIQTNPPLHKNQSLQDLIEMGFFKALDCVSWERIRPVNEWLHLVDGWRELCYTVVCSLSFRHGLEVVGQSVHIWRDARVFQ